jgi:O-antigen ligase
MELTLIGGLVIGLGFLLSILSHQRLLQCIVFFASFSGTAVLNFGEYGMAPDVVLLSFLLLVSFLSGRILFPVRVSGDHLIVGFLILVFAAITVFSSLFNWAVHGVVSLQVTQTAYLLFGICLTLVLSIEFSSLERLEAGLAALRASATFISLWGLFQAVCYYTGIAYPAFLFNNSKSHFADMYDQRAAEGVVRIASVATEPSFMATSLMIFGAFGATVITLDPLRRSATWVIPVFLTLITVALSTSSTGYCGLAVLGLLLARRHPTFALATFGSVAIVGAIFLMSVPSAWDAFHNMTLGKFQDGSYVERSTTFAPAIDLFLRQPWFGFGWGADFSYSITTFMLANVGLVGSVSFLIAVAVTLIASAAARKKFVTSDTRLAVYAEAAENALIVYLAESVVSGFKYVVADFWCLWAFVIVVPSCLVCVGEGFRSSAFQQPKANGPL